MIGQPFQKNEPSWIIRDVIVGNRSSITNIYVAMWDNKISNEEALTFVTIDENDYDIFVISHQWNYGSGSLLFENLSSHNAHSS